MLMNARHYQLAADLLQAGASGDNAAQTMGLATMLRSAPHHEDFKFGNTPVDVVKRAFLMGMDPDVTEDQLKSISSRNALVIWKIQSADEKKKALEAGKTINSQLARGDSSLDVTTDVFLEAVDPKGDGNDDVGYKEKVQIPGGPTITFFIVKEDGQYKLLDSDDKPNAIGLEIVDRAKAGDLKGAKALLDWLREDTHVEGGDDPFGGPGFPRYWTKGQTGDLRKITLAGAAILVGYKPTAPQGIQIFEDALKTTTSDHEKTLILLGLSRGYANIENFQRQFDVSSELLKQEPDSRSTFLESASALMGLGRYDDAIALADERLKLLDSDTDALRMKMQVEANHGNIPASLNWAHKLIDLGKDDAEVENEIAWFALFGDKVGDTEVAAAIKATQLATDNPHILHTLACDYAAAGKAKEAHEVLLRSMDDLNLDEPSDDYWYALGSIAEQYGERDIAIADFRKLKKPEEQLSIPTSSYHLAQNRLKVLGVDQSPDHAANQPPTSK
jgi:tetratricopeptide (TPR) repeat protein